MEQLQTAIEAITRRSKKFPQEEFETICANKEEAIPCLRGAIEKAIAEGENLDGDYQLHFYAMFLLAQFQDRDFFPRMMELACLPEDTVDFLMGDAMTESLPTLLYNMYNGDIRLLKDAVCSPDVGDYVRSGLLRVMGQLYLDGTLGKQDWQDFLRQIVYGEEIGDYVYTALADVICRCHFVEMLPEIYRLYEDDRIEGRAIGGYDECVDEVFTYRDSRENFCKSPVQAVQMLRGWAMFDDPEAEKRSRELEKNFSQALRKLDQEFNRTEPKRKIGRNDPCPCGSGKKYKQCCLNKPKSPLDLVETPQEKARWLKEYPAARQGGDGDRIYLEDYFSHESIEIDKLLYLALKHRAIPIWRREEESVVHNRRRVYLSAAYERFRTLLEEEGIESFQAYDRKHSIHYHCQDWLEVLEELLEEEDPEGILEDVRGFFGKMGK